MVMCFALGDISCKYTTSQKAQLWLAITLTHVNWF